MALTRGKMTQGERKVTSIALSIFAVISFLVAAGWEWTGILVWAGYWVFGIPAVWLGLWFFDVILEARYDPSIESKETEGLRGIIYVTWIATVPLMGIAAFVVSMFRFALNLID